MIASNSMIKEKNSSIKIHGFTPFDRSGKVRWLLTELGLDYESMWINPSKKENEKSEYLALNPMGRVPVIEIDKHSLFESGAICAYLSDLYLDKGLAPALTSSDRAKYQQWMYFASATIDTLQIRIMIIEDIPAGAVQKEKETAALNDFRDALTALDSVLKEDHYLISNRFSTADICVGYHLYYLQFWPEFKVIMDEFPSIFSYLNRLKERPAALHSKVFSYEE